MLLFALMAKAQCLISLPNAFQHRPDTSYEQLTSSQPVRHTILKSVAEFFFSQPEDVNVATSNSLNTLFKHIYSWEGENRIDCPRFPNSCNS